MKSSWKLALGLLLIGACAAGASAATTVELRFATGDPNHVVVQANTDYTVDLWADVTGTNLSKADGLLFLYAALQSSQYGGTGTLQGGSGVGITSFHLNSFWKGQFASDGNKISNSTAQNPSDSIQDWGRYSVAQSGTTIYAASPLSSSTLPQYVSTINDPNYAYTSGNTAYFKIGTLTIHTGNLATPTAGAATSFEAIQIRSRTTDSNVTWQVFTKPLSDYADQATDSNYAFANYNVGNAVWFLTATNSQIMITNPDTSDASTGASSKTVNLGKVLKGAAIGGSLQSITKTGSDYTNFGVTYTGNATSTFTPGYLAGGTQTASGLVGLSASGYGTASGTVTITNNSWGAGAGHGQDDAVDVFSVSANVGIATAADSGTNNRNSFVSGEALSGTVAAGGSYAGLASKTLAGDRGRTYGTEATLLAGTNPNSAAQTVTMNWRSVAYVERWGSTRLISDVVDIEGIAKDGGQTSGSRQETGTYVVSLSYDAALLDANSAASLATRGGIYLAYLNEDYDGTPGPTVGDMWQIAVAGNFGGTANFKIGAYNPSTDFVLGKYGIDTTTHTVWAVVNHNSQFAVVPEPGTLALLILGAVAAIRRRRH